jgi:DNA-binding PadR family transcriptional regulator
MDDYFDRRGGGFRGQGPWRGQARFGDYAGPPEGERGFEGGPGFPPGFGHGHRRGGPPPWRGGRRARRGDIRVALLHALTDGPAHGYELIGRLEARTGGAWRPSAGSVYPTLQLLEDEGLVTGRDDGGKRVFELTDQGRQAASEAADRVGPGAWSGPGSGAQAGMRQAMRGLVLAIRQVTVAGDDDQMAAATAVVTEARQRLYRILAGESTGESAQRSDQPGE